MIRTIIIEDEPSALSLLSRILIKHCPEIEIIAFADNDIDGYDVINTKKPDLVFLNTELKNTDSFQILQKIENINFKIIFTSSTDHQSLKAFKYEAIHYILKPYKVPDIIESIRRVKDILQRQKPYNKLGKKSKERKTHNSTQITISTKEGLTVIPFDEIIRIKAERSYCYMYLTSKEKIMISKPLKKFDETLPKNIFFRTHHSHLINMKYVNQYRKEDGGEIIMKDGSAIPLARRRKSMFLDMF